MFNKLYIVLLASYPCSKVNVLVITTPEPVSTGCKNYEISCVSVLRIYNIIILFYSIYSVQHGVFCSSNSVLYLE